MQNMLSKFYTFLSVINLMCLRYVNIDVFPKLFSLVIA